MPTVGCQPVLIKAEELLADNIDQDSHFGEHLDEHGRLKPSMPAGYPVAAAALEASPPMPVPPVAAGQVLSRSAM